MRRRGVLLLLSAIAFAAYGQESMPGMKMPGPAVSTSAPAVPNLLAEAEGRPALTLDALLQAARAHSPLLHAAAAAARQSAGLALQAGLLPNPVVGYQGEQIRGGSYNGGEQGGFVEQTLPLGGKLGLRREVYREQQRGDTLTLAVQQARVDADVEAAFYHALTLQQQVETRLRLSELAADAAQTARQLANVGQADTPDVLQAEVEQQQAALDASTTQRQYIGAFRQLAALTGQPEMPLARLEGKLEASEPPPLDSLLQQSPVMARADQAVHAAEARLRSARRDAVPDLTLRAGEQWNNELLTTQPRKATGAQSFATASVDLPLWNRNQGNVAAAQAALEQARAEAEQARVTLRQSAAPLVEQYRAAEAEAAQYRNEILPRAQRAYELYRDRYQQMAAAYPQVLVSQRTLVQLQLSYVMALGQMAQTASALRHFTLSAQQPGMMP